MDRLQTQTIGQYQVLVSPDNAFSSYLSLCPSLESDQDAQSYIWSLLYFRVLVNT